MPTCLRYRVHATVPSCCFALSLLHKSDAILSVRNAQESKSTMTPVHKLCVGAVVITLATTYLAYQGASSSWQFYVSVDELVADTQSFCDSRIRVSGKVAADSLQIAADRTQGAFVLQGASSELVVKFTGPIPDNLAEGIDVVVEGRLQNAGVVQGSKVLTRCASKYASRQ